MTVELDTEQQTADIDGLICAYLLDGEGGGTGFDWAQVRAWTPGDGLLWVHLDRLAEPARDWLLNESGIEIPFPQRDLLLKSVSPEVRAAGIQAVADPPM